MANDHSTYPLNLSLDFFDNLDEILSKASALAYVASSNQFFEADQKIMSDYLWQLSDLIDEAKRLLKAILRARDDEK